MATPFLPPGTFVDPSHVIAMWVEPETLARVGIGALPLGIDDDERDRPPPPATWDEGPVAPNPEFQPAELKDGLAPNLDGFPTGSVDVPADYLFRAVAFMESECDVIRVETKGNGADAPIRLTGFRDNGEPVFDDTKPIVIAAIAPRGKGDVEP